MRTPAGRPLAVPGSALAGAIAEEWAAQGETIDREAMPLTRLACTALDLVPERRADIVTEIAAYAETDLVCYRTDEPPALARRQAAAWQPLVDWAAERHGAHLAVTSSITPIAQAPAALEALRDAVAGEDDFALAGLGLATRSFGSLVIALAVRGAGWMRGLPPTPRSSTSAISWSAGAKTRSLPPAAPTSPGTPPTPSACFACSRPDRAPRMAR